MAFLSSCAYELVVIGDDGEAEVDGDGQPIATGGLVNLGIPRWGRRIGKDRQDIELKTELGRNWIFPQYDEQTFGFTFRATPDVLEVLRTLDEAVGGRRDPFIFYPFIDTNPDIALFVRKDSKFDESREQPGLIDGAIDRIVDYELIITTEPDGAEVSA